ncbi:hypothetical protein L596_017081 [Steinernema carpocapsae]|uniref:Uncharacterized protein n=1 Tax=Steinernema carpocapsae TaxID=34508 RepID=A0A4V6A1L5_STECR|nr:hypothetical protein L596_017081 [Steinernema carpocapsae]
MASRRPHPEDLNPQPDKKLVAIPVNVAAVTGDMPEIVYYSEEPMRLKDIHIDDTVKKLKKKCLNNSILLQALSKVTTTKCSDLP